MRLLQPLVLTAAALAACALLAEAQAPDTERLLEGERAGEAGIPSFAGERLEQRRRMVETQIERRGVDDPRVLAALRAVPRHRFVPDERRDRAYADSPLPIGHGQTISQPYIVAFMTERLGVGPGDRVLEVGTGSGYQAAVLGAMGVNVVTLEIIRPLAERAAQRLDALGFGNISVFHGDGYFGHEPAAPYDAIIVTAAARHVPPPLIEQLAPGGRMVIPVGRAGWTQNLLLVQKDADGRTTTRNLMSVAFVPLTGER
jgi:protein-L-isoaspartate(D-aspartate) O-methyltransferase